MLSLAAGVKRDPGQRTKQGVSVILLLDKLIAEMMGGKKGLRGTLMVFIYLKSSQM